MCKKRFIVSVALHTPGEKIMFQCSFGQHSPHHCPTESICLEILHMYILFVIQARIKVAGPSG